MLNKENFIKKCRNYFDLKAKVSPLKKHSHCLLPNPKVTLKNTFAANSLQIWLPVYRVDEVHAMSNYLICKAGTNYTEVVNGMRLRP